VVAGTNCNGVATISSSQNAPVVDCSDIANYGAPTKTDKWWGTLNEGRTGAAKGQTFTTGDREVLLRSVTYQLFSTAPVKQYVIRVGTANETTRTFNEIYTETATQNSAWNMNDYVTWTFGRYVPLKANTVYGVDIRITSSTSPWQAGIPYINITGDEYPGGTLYHSGPPVVADNEMFEMGGDRIFHLDLHQSGCEL
jgi:hypothetical protein